VEIRVGSSVDVPVVLALFDEAVEWLVKAGRGDQWGKRPFSTNRQRQAQITVWAAEGRLRLAQLGTMVIGSVAVGPAPPYVPQEARPELYVEGLVVAREFAGKGIGRLLLDRAYAEAVDRGAEVLRVDCFAGGDGALVRYYERHGFRPTIPLRVGQWPGQLLERVVDPRDGDPDGDQRDLDPAGTSV
jgi:GNAT superfamily N-acetyltransferase